MSAKNPEPTQRINSCRKYSKCGSSVRPLLSTRTKNCWLAILDVISINSAHFLHFPRHTIQSLWLMVLREWTLHKVAWLKAKNKLYRSKTVCFCFNIFCINSVKSPCLENNLWELTALGGEQCYCRVVETQINLMYRFITPLSSISALPNSSNTDLTRGE